jgi:hypothetical protein
LRRAVELNGDNKLYRNNLAAVYVEQGKNKEALEQLVAAHGEAVGNYNLAYLLTQKQDDTAALVHFRKAAARDPSLVAAHQWIDKLQATDGHAGQYAGAVAVVASGQGGYAPPAHQVAQHVGPEPAAGAFVQTSNVSHEPQQPVAPQHRGLRYPPRGGAEASGDAVPPSPGSRLPSVAPNGG